MWLSYIKEQKISQVIWQVKQLQGKYLFFLQWIPFLTAPLPGLEKIIFMLGGYYQL